jgi:3-hydroxy-3-methylglutaryl CoA synthase
MAGAGIARTGAYVPRLRLDRGAIAAAWGTKQPPGEVAVANYDEDALTLAVEAAMECLGDSPPPVGGVHFASASAPYWEKQMASVLATACDLPRAIFAADYAGSARAGVSALLGALRTVQADGADAVLVAAADVRVAEPESDLEGLIGDGAGAALVANRDVVAEFVDAASVAEQFTYVWRIDTARTVQASAGKFATTYGYSRDLGEAIRRLLERQQVAPAAVARVALGGPDARAPVELARSIGFDPKRQLVEPLTARIGWTGCAEPLLLLGGALEAAAPGDLVLVGAYGEGADALLFRATDAIGDRPPASRLSEWIAAKTMLSSYQKYLKYRRLLPVEEIMEVVTNVLEFKELKQDVRLYGSRCLACGTVQYPIARVCIQCRTPDRLEDVRLARRGTVFTYTVDHLSANVEHPLPMAVVDLDGGGRVYLQVTDTDTTAVGMPVRLTYRRIHEGEGSHHYYWKARPRRP